MERFGFRQLPIFQQEPGNLIVLILFEKNMHVRVHTYLGKMYTKFFYIKILMMYTPFRMSEIKKTDHAKNDMNVEDLELS